MMKCTLLLCLATLCLGQGTAPGGYGAPSGGYGAPSAPTAPQATYGGDYDYSSYEPQAQEAAGGDDLGAKLGELVPLFIAVFAAIILAQLLAPLFLQLLMLLTGILPMALGIKAPIINALLAPFNLALAEVCDPAAPAVFTGTFPAPCPVAGRAFTGRAFAEEAATLFGFDVSDAKVSIMADLVENGLASFTSRFRSVNGFFW